MVLNCIDSKEDIAPALRHMGRSDIAWLAGLIEGEGCIVSHQIAVRLVMTDRDTIERAAQLMGTRVTKRSSQTAARKDVWITIASGSTGRAVMEATLPWMCLRRADAMIRSLAYGKGWRRRARARLTSDVIAQVKSSLAEGRMSQAEIARMADTRPETISRIHTGHYYKDDVKHYSA